MPFFSFPFTWTRPWMIAAVSCLGLGYLLCWQRGLYLDDYMLHRDAHAGMESALAKWCPCPGGLPVARGLGYALMLVVSAGIPDHEFLVRLFAAVLIGMNGLLLGWFVRRTTASPLAGLVAGWLFLMPTFAEEAVLWTCCIDYLAGTALMLVFLHCQWSALRTGGKAWPWLIGGSVALGASLLMKEAFAPALAVVPALAVLGPSRRGTARPRLRAMAQAVVPLTLALFIFVRNYLLLSSHVMLGRGGVDLSYEGLTTRLSAFRLAWARMVYKSHGRAMNGGETMPLGWEYATETWIGVALLVIAVAGVAWTVWRWRVGAQAHPGALGRLLIVAVCWFIAAALVPGVLVRNQVDLSPRMTYVPAAAACAAVGAAVALLLRMLPRVAVRPVIAVAGAVLVANSLVMLGHARAYQARWVRDAEDLDNLTAAAPVLLPDAWVITLPGGRDLFPGRAAVRGNSLYGVLDIEVLSDVVVRARYDRADVTVLPLGGWPRRKVFELEGADSARVLVVDGIRVPLDRAVIYSPRDGGQLITHLNVRRRDGTILVVEVPGGKGGARVEYDLALVGPP